MIVATEIFLLITNSQWY